MGWGKLRWQRPQLVLPLAGMQLDFGGYVKEYAADRVAGLCRELGLRHGLVDLGGDLAVVGPHPDGSPWRVGIRHPRAPEGAIASLALTAGGIATSGDYERCLVVDGRRYAHLLNPKTGWPVDGLASVTVAASHCLIAGTASTIAMLKGARAGPAWLDRLGLPSLRVDSEGNLSGPLATGEDVEPLRPELVDGVEIPDELPELDDLAVPDPHAKAGRVVERRPWRRPLPRKRATALASLAITSSISNRNVPSLSAMTLPRNARIASRPR